MVLDTIILTRVARYLICHRVIGINHQFQNNQPQFDCCTVVEWAGNVTKRLLTTTAGAWMRGSLDGGKVGGAESQNFIIGRVGIPWTGNRNGKKIDDEIHLS